ncbi:hypothetical protein [Neomegalonema sp.]|uniref:hypothetical protein n=1 Tax=Neomegalonema sp. TaxID=2039713 RepID=UPI00261956DF|nr:hypothetical protein [Neomegalonema sp.]MDD2869074.1 hypothetical protein [Neomegalonema sp.]
MPLVLAAALGWIYGFFLTRRRGLPIQDQIHRAFVYAMAFGLAAFVLGVLVSWLSPSAPPPSV